MTTWCSDVLVMCSGREDGRAVCSKSFFVLQPVWSLFQTLMLLHGHRTVQVCLIGIKLAPLEAELLYPSIT